VKLSLNQVSSNAIGSLEEAEPGGGGHLQMSTDDWYQIQPTPADEVDALYTSHASSNYNGYASPVVDQLAAQAKQTFDTTARNKLYARMQAQIGEDAPYVFLTSTDWLAGVTQRISNYQYRGETYSYYDRMWV
jgi:ABC-type transport system substrate-binding protein